jgi:translation initiation factor 2 beta subunit (eIF-2beta)/eIF-5
MTLVLTKGERERVLRCMDCGQLDPMQNAETQGWLSGELGSSALSQKE